MNIQLDHLVPIPLRDKIKQQGSEVWDRAITLDAGRFVKIKAPSGTGKTTLVHYLYNIRYDHSGQVLLDGKAWAGFSKDEVASLRQQGFTSEAGLDDLGLQIDTLITAKGLIAEMSLEAGLSVQLVAAPATIVRLAGYATQAEQQHLNRRIALQQPGRMDRR